MAAAIATLSERKPGLIGITSRASAAADDLVGHPGRFAPEQQDVRCAIAIIKIGSGAFGREKHQPEAASWRHSSNFVHEIVAGNRT